MLSFFEKVWTVLTQREDKPTQVALAICVIATAVVLGCGAAFFYGVTARSSGLANRTVGGLVALLACVGSFSVGGMLGLLFGSPTLGNSQVPTKAESESNSSQLGVRPNTSLERVADWLTTMIVGLGLVNLGPIGRKAATMSIWLTQAITGKDSSNGSPGIAIALAFSFAGFLLMYLWCLRFLPSELRDSYQLLRRVEIAEAKADGALTVFKQVAVFEVPTEKLDQIKARLEENGVGDADANEIVARYRLAKKADDEPMENFGMLESQGYKLDAVVKEPGDGKFNVIVTLSVPPNATSTKVFWLLHNSYTPEVISDSIIRPPESTSYTATVDEAFWIGAIIPLGGKKSVKLALSMAKIPNAPAKFVSTP